LLVWGGTRQMESISVALVDDHPLMLAGLVDLFQLSEGFTVAATGTKASDVLKISTDVAPDVFVVDLMMPGNIFEVIAKTVATSLKTKFLAFTALARSDFAVRALNVGASGYVLKGSDAGELIQGVRAVHNGETFITPAFACKVIE